jgi:2-phospho-L-lactate guanylyltransferase
MVWAILPLKDFVNAKQRLSGVLAPHERRRVFQAMVNDVLDVLSIHPAIEQTVIISDDPSAEMLAEHYGVMHWEEAQLQAKGLNGVIEAAAATLAEQGVADLMIVHGDLPLVSAEEIQVLVDAHLNSEKPAVSISPDSPKQGTNCMICSPPQVIRFHYGENSFNKHSDEATSHNITVNVVPQSGLGCDIDNPADLNELLASEQTLKHSFRYLHDSGIAGRLSAMSIGDIAIAPAIGSAEL